MSMQGVGMLRFALMQTFSLPLQFAGSGRGSLASDGRTNSWASGGKGTNTLTHLSQHSGSLHDAQSFMLLEEPHSPGYSQPLHVSETHAQILGN